MVSAVLHLTGLKTILTIDNIFFCHKNLNFIEKTLNEELLYLTDWCRANKLSINIIK